MKIKFLSTLLIAAFTAFQVHASTTGKTLPTEPYVVDGYTPDTRTADDTAEYWTEERTWEETEKLLQVTIHYGE